MVTNKMATILNKIENQCHFLLNKDVIIFLNHLQYTLYYRADTKASLESKHILFSYFIITEPTELKLSEIAIPGNIDAVNFFQNVLYRFSNGIQPSWIECCV